MDDVLRQRSINLKTAVTHMIAGDADLTVHSLGADVREVPPDRLADTAAHLWLALPPQERARTMILAPTHAQREAITAVLRLRLAEDGVITGRALHIERLIDRRLTRILAADPLSYQQGDIVVANRDVYGCQKGEAWRVTARTLEWITLERRGVTGGFKPSGNAAHAMYRYSKHKQSHCALAMRLSSPEISRHPWWSMARKEQLRRLTQNACAFACRMVVD